MNANTFRLLASLTGILLTATASLAVEHNVASGSKGNHLELAIQNGSSGRIAVLKAEVTDLPEWVIMSSHQIILRGILPGKEAPVRFDFDIDRLAQVGSEGSVVITVGAGSERWIKTIPLKVTAPDRYALSQNYPNPFNPTTRIEYTIPHSGEVSLKVYNLLGERIKTLVDDVEEAGVKILESPAVDFHGEFEYHFLGGKLL